MGRILVQRVAFYWLRLEHSRARGRIAPREDPPRRGRVRRAEVHRGRGPALGASPIVQRPTPGGSSGRPKGFDATIRAWLDLKADLGKSNARRWTAAHCERANNLTGRRIDEIPISRINELSYAIWGDFGLLEDHEGAGLDEKARQAWARERMAELIDEEVKYLREYRETLDLEAFELDREEAGQRALFDPSKEATLARRYEAAAERGLFRATPRIPQGRARGGRESPSDPGPALRAVGFVWRGR